MTAAGGNGTVNPPFAPVVEKDPTTGQNSHYQSITAMQAYRGFSFEVCRLFLEYDAMLEKDNQWNVVTKFWRRLLLSTVIHK